MDTEASERARRCDCSNILKRGEICNGFLCTSPNHPIMEAVVDGMCTNLETYESSWEAVGKLGVLRLTGPLAMSEIVYSMLHMHPHLLVDGFGKLGIDFYAVQTFKKLIKSKGDYVGSRTVHYSKLKSKAVLDCEDKRWNRKTEKRPRGSVGASVV